MLHRAAPWEASPGNAAIDFSANGVASLCWKSLLASALQPTVGHAAEKAEGLRGSPAALHPHMPALSWVLISCAGEQTRRNSTEVNGTLVA